MKRLRAASHRVPRWALAVLCTVGAVLSAWLGLTYIPRMSQHAGYFLVDVDDAIASPPTSVARRATLVVVDGLREDVAREMTVVDRLRRAGQCRTSDVGPYTVSRPIYALLSTGLEVERSGARNNDETSPLRAESIWDVAAEAGRSVGVASHLPWWQELFPKAFVRAVDLDESVDVFAVGVALQTDVTVIHPVYVDTMGHDFGAASPEYAAAAARADREATQWLASVDLQRDLVIFTADHGHIDIGGHGAGQPEIRSVLVCMAGPSIAALGDTGAMDSRIVAPTIAIAMGLRFPRNMRAGQDGLDTLWSIFELTAEYLADRQHAVERYRERNTAALADWLGDDSDPTWASLVEQQWWHRAWRIVLPLVVIAFGVGASLWARGLRRREAIISVAWMGATIAATCAAWVALRGSLDYTSINLRSVFVPASLVVCVVVATFAAVVHLRWIADRQRWVGDQATLALVIVLLELAHGFAFGWPLGFPLPHRMVLFFPFLASTFGVVHSVIAAAALMRR